MIPLDRLRAFFKARERAEREENPSTGKITALFMSEALRALTATFKVVT